MNTSVQREIDTYVKSRGERVIEIVRDLVRIPSENKAPHGAENTCQQYVAAALRTCGWNPTLYRPDEAPGITEHPVYWAGREYKDRPNVGARRSGSGDGRSLVLSGHIDTVPIGSEPWTTDPFGGEIRGNQLFGRGSNDMKAGIATSLFVVEALADLDLQLAGDLIFESVADEEFGGVNGTLAGRLMGFNGDAAVITEPSFLRICPAQRGGRIVHLTFNAANEGILGRTGGAGVIEQLRVFLDELRNFELRRRERVRAHPLYAHVDNHVPVAVTRIFTAPWGSSEATNIPGKCRVELYWQAMPGETREDIDREFFGWLDEVCAAHPDVFTAQPETHFPIRCLPGSAISPDEPLVQELSACATEVLGRAPLIQGIEAPCDMYVFHQFGTPAVLWGPRGGNAHNADEYVEIDSLLDAASVLLTFVCRWCGVK
jgi:acetylornithine deacetylase